LGDRKGNLQVGERTQQLQKGFYWEEEEKRTTRFSTPHIRQHEGETEENQLRGKEPPWKNLQKQGKGLKFQNGLLQAIIRRNRRISGKSEKASWQRDNFRGDQPAGGRHRDSRGRNVKSNPPQMKRGTGVLPQKNEKEP